MEADTDKHSFHLSLLVGKPPQTPHSLPEAWLGLSRHGAISTLASRRLEANLGLNSVC